MRPRPTPEYVKARISEFDADPRNRAAERGMELVFKQWPKNTDYSEILIKVIVLNRLYSTSIYDPYSVAKHILDHKIDERLIAGDTTLVEDIAKVQFRKGPRVLYSFTTKYCGWHQPDHYQLYDGFVDWLLWAYRQQFKFADFKRPQLREYRQFLTIVDQFKTRFKLHDFTRKELDKFLWIEGVRQQRNK